MSALAEPALNTVTGDRLAQGGQRLGLEFDQRVALLAIEVIMLRIAIVVLVDRPATEDHIFEQPGIDQFGERAVDRRPADTAGRRRLAQMQNQIVGVKVLVPRKHFVDDHPPLLRNPFPPAGQKLFESLHRRRSDLDSP